MDEMLAKRVRRCEVSNLEQAEDISEIRSALRALYEALIHLARRVPSSSVGADPIDMLMLPPWHKNPATGNILPPPAGLDLDTRGLAAFRYRLEQLTIDEGEVIKQCQERHKRRLETLRTREAERKTQLEKPAKSKAQEVTLEM